MVGFGGEEGRRILKAEQSKVDDMRPRERTPRQKRAAFARVAASSARATAGTPRAPGRDTGQRWRRGTALRQERR